MDPKFIGPYLRLDGPNRYPYWSFRLASIFYVAPILLIIRRSDGQRLGLKSNFSNTL